MKKPSKRENKLAEEAWKQGHLIGQAHGEAMLINRIVHDLIDDKLRFIDESMMNRAYHLSIEDNQGHKRKDKEWAAFCEGVRQTLNILQSPSVPRRAYDEILNRSMDLIDGKKRIKPTI